MKENVVIDCSHVFVFIYRIRFSINVYIILHDCSYLEYYQIANGKMRFRFSVMLLKIDKKQTYE